MSTLRYLLHSKNKPELGPEFLPIDILHEVFLVFMTHQNQSKIVFFFRAEHDCY